MWWWVLAWTVLVLLAAAVLGGLAWGVVRRGVALGRELAQAGARPGELAARVEPPPAPHLPRHAVLDDPSVLRAQHEEQRAGARRARAARRAARSRRPTR